MRAQHTRVIRIGRRTERQLWRAVVTAAAALIVALCLLVGPAARSPPPTGR